jgi:hypothetical protein
MRNKKRNRKKADVMFSLVFVVILVVIMVLNLLAPNKEVSADENRRLAGRPRFSADSLLSGEYMEKYEKYLSDQFGGREVLRNARVVLNRLGGSKEENGVLIGKNGQLMEKLVVPDQEVLGNNLDAIVDFAEKNQKMPVYMILVPDAANVLNKDLPLLYTAADQKRMIAQVKRELDSHVTWIDVESVLNKHTDDTIYYKTDKHWTSAGAYYVFQAAAELMDISKGVSGKFATYPITTTFNGDLAAKSGCEKHVKEVIEIYIPLEGDTDVIVNYVDEQRKSTSLYDSSKLEGSNQYEVFLGGDSSVIDIKTVSESTRRLLVVKDSFANSFLPFLTPYFREIVVVDPQYYGGTIDEIMDTYRITDTLILYSGNTFFQDNNISGVLNSEQ